MAFEVNSVPLSVTIICGLPRLPMSTVNSRATRLPEIEVSGIAARHSRVTSSTMLRMRKRRSNGQHYSDLTQSAVILRQGVNRATFSPEV
jgi:hypothetical protein